MSADEHEHRPLDSTPRAPEIGQEADFLPPEGEEVGADKGGQEGIAKPPGRELWQQSDPKIRKALDTARARMRKDERAQPGIPQKGAAVLETGAPDGPVKFEASESWLRTTIDGTLVPRSSRCRWKRASPAGKGKWHAYWPDREHGHHSICGLATRRGALGQKAPPRPGDDVCRPCADAVGFQRRARRKGRRLSEAEKTVDRLECAIAGLESAAAVLEGLGADVAELVRRVEGKGEA